MQAQELLLKSKEKELRLRPPDWSDGIPLWDETKQSVRFHVPSVKSTITASLDVMSIIFLFGWGWKDGESEYIRVLIPPLVLSNVSGMKLWDALRTHPWTKIAWSFWMTLSVGVI